MKHSAPNTIRHRSLTILIGLLCIFGAVLINGQQAYAAVSKTIHIEWDYTNTVPQLAGYRIYQDGVFVKEIIDPKIFSADITALLSADETFFTMTAFDVNGNEGPHSDPYVVNVSNFIQTAPVLEVSFTSDLQTGSAPLEITFVPSARSSSSIITNYTWDFGDGVTFNDPSGGDIIHTYITSGSYTAKLTITDDLGNQKSYSALIDAISSENSPPIAVINAAPTNGVPPLEVSFSASASSDTDGHLIEYFWDFGDGTTSLEENVLHEYAIPGTYTVSLQVTDNLGATEIATDFISVDELPSAGNLPPIAVLNTDKISGGNPLTVFFDATSSADNDGDIAFFSWDFGDGSTAETASADHTYEIPGVYTVTLSVSDNNGATDVANTVITVTEQPDLIAYSGTVTVNGQPLEEILIRVFDSNGNPIANYPVDPYGNYVTDPMPPNTYIFMATYGNKGKMITPGQTDNWQLPLFTINGSISGLAQNEPIPVIIAVFSPQHNLFKSVRLNVSGTTPYSLTNLLPAKDYIVSAVTLNHPVQYFNNSYDITQASPIALTSGNVGNINFAFSSASLATLHGQLTYNGTPSGTAPVYAYETNTHALQVATTDSNGTFNLSLLPGDYLIFTIKNQRMYFYANSGTVQYEAKATVIPVQQTDYISGKNITITDCNYTISGFVQGQNQTPIKGALVTAKGQTNYASSFTDTDGFYSITNLCTDTYELYMNTRAQEYPVRTATVALTTKGLTQNFTVDSGHTLSGTVKDLDTSQVITGARLSLHDSATGKMYGAKLFTTDSNGLFTIKDIADGTYSVRIAHKDYQTTFSPDISIDMDKTLNITLQKGFSIYGTVLNTNNQPMQGVLVSATAAGQPSEYAMTDKNGEYKMTGLAVTTAYTLTARKQLMTTVHSSDVSPTASGTQVDFVLSEPNQTMSFLGIVRNACDQSPVANAQIIITTTSDGATPIFYKNAITNNAGAYSVNDLPKSSGYTIIVKEGGSTRASRFNVPDEESASIVKNIELDCGSSISGIIEIGTPAASVFVVLYNAKDQFVDYKRIDASDITGLQSTIPLNQFPFSFANLPNGNYKVVASADGNVTTWYGGADKNTASLAPANTKGITISLPAQ